MPVEVGQVLWMRIRFNTNGDTSNRAHPCLVVDVDRTLNVIEIVQFSSLEGKSYKVAFRGNKLVECKNPTETVINQDSFVQMDNKFTIELFPEINQYRRQTGKLSSGKLKDVIDAYRQYHKKYKIDESRIVFMKKEEILELNRSSYTV